MVEASCDELIDEIRPGCGEVVLHDGRDSVGDLRTGSCLRAGEGDHGGDEVVIVR